MAQIQFNAAQFKPAIVGASSLPISDSNGWAVKIVASEIKPTKNNDGGFLELTLEIIEGEHEGDRGAYRINLFHPNEKTVSIAQEQLSAVCYVTRVLSLSDTTQLHGIPFRAVVGLQKKKSPTDPDYTEVKGVKDYEGNNPNPSKVASQSASSAAPQFNSSSAAPQFTTQSTATSHPPVWEPNAPAATEGIPGKPVWVK